MEMEGEQKVRERSSKLSLHSRLTGTPAQGKRGVLECSYYIKRVELESEMK